MSEIQKEIHASPEQPAGKDGWEREIIEKLALAAVTEQQKARRWGIFFKSLMFIYLVALLGIAVYPRFETDLGDSGDKHTAVVNIVGMIAEGEESTAENIIKGIRDAVKNKGTKGVVLHMNSQGGSPVQSAYVYEEIRRIKQKNPEMPIYAVVSDMCASGCYYIASAADKVFVNQASIVGSIGVIMNGFGFVDTLHKFGIERRLLIAGSHKAMLDPFSPVNEAENRHMQTLLDEVHQQFIDAVRQGRGERLKETPDMFSGLVWTGEQGVKLGLADGFGSDDYVAREVIGQKKLVNFTPHERLIDQLAGKLGASFGQAIGSFVQGWSWR